MNHELNSFSIEHELQIRLLNLVVDEASDYERDQLMHLMEQRPEAKLYLEHLQHMHGLLRTVGAGDWNQEPEPESGEAGWKLPDDRRNALLLVLDSKSVGSTQNQFMTLSKPLIKDKRLSYGIRFAVLAASICVLASVFALPAVYTSRQSAKLKLSMDRAPSTRSIPKPNSPDVSSRYLDQIEAEAASSKVTPFSPPLSASESQPVALPQSVTVPNGGTIMLGGITRDWSAPETNNEENVFRKDFARQNTRAYDEPDSAKTFRDSDSDGVSDATDFFGRGLGGAINNAPVGEKTFDLATKEKSESQGGGVPLTTETARSSQSNAGMGGGLEGTGIWGTTSVPGGNHAPPRAKESKVLSDNFPSIDANARHDANEFSNNRSEKETENASPGPWSVNRLFKNNSVLDRTDSNPMMTVTPRLIIPEEEEERLLPQSEGRFSDAQNEQAEPVSRFAFPALEKKEGLDKAKQISPAKPVAPVREMAASTEPFSTFSLYVSDVSFQLAQSALSQGQWPARTSLRPEEFLNAFDYQDPTPNDAEMVACQIEQSTHPFQMQRNLLRIALKTGSSGRALNMPLRLTVLLDISGSMQRRDRKQAVQNAFLSLARQLRDQDRITLIAFANTPRLVADRYNSEQALSLSTLIEKTPSQGGTNIEAALALAREKALEQFVNGGQNRIVMLTDGAVNLGNADPMGLSQQIVALRNEGIAFDAAGICAQDLNDEVLEALTRQGDGRYYLINAEDGTSESFSKQIAGALRPTAKNVKVQVEFNPQRVGQYRLIGFEKHQLEKEDFRNDSIDAAELAAAEAGVAMYQVEIKPDGHGDVGSVSVRFQDVSTGNMVERRWPIPYNSKTPSVGNSKPSMQLASAATLFAVKLRGEPNSDRIDFPALAGLVSSLPSAFAHQPRVQALLTMIHQARALEESGQ